MWNNCGRYFLLLVFLNTSALLYSQNIETIKGRIVNSETLSPVPFATIKVKRTMTGVISNMDGDFQLSGNLTMLSDTVVVSCIGYATRSIVVRDLVSSQGGQISLSPSILELSAVEIQGRRIGKLSGAKVVKEAIRRISANYAFQPFSYVAYYRDYQIERGDYVNLNEAVVEVLDKGFGSNDQLETKVKLLLYRANVDFGRDTSTATTYDPQYKFIPNARLSSFGGNELSILRVHDVLRNHNMQSFSFAFIFRKDFLPNHSFTLEEQVNFGNVLLYRIKFESRRDVSGPRHFAEGYIYIEKNDYAIHKIEYKTYERTAEQPRLLYDIQLEYARNDSIMYLNYISFNNVFKIRNPMDFKATDISLLKDAHAFSITFNNPVDVESQLAEKNFNLKIGDKKLRIMDISVNGRRDEVRVTFEVESEIDLMEADATLMPKIKIELKDIKDIYGNEINSVTFKDVNQYRELFVQKLTGMLPSVKDSVWMDRNTPMAESKTLSDDAILLNYLMNTPLKSN